MIIPAIMEKEFGEAERKIRLIRDYCRWIQIDVMDGMLAPGKTFELELLSRSEMDLSSQLFDIHLLTKEPEKWIEKCNFIGASRIVGQVELMGDRESFTNKVKEAGLEAGLGFDIDTEVGDIPEDTDVVLLMGRKAGFGSYSLDERLWSKIRETVMLREKNEMRYKIGVDGGVSQDNIKRLKDEGVEIFYCTGAIFSGDPEYNIEKLKHAIR